MLNTVLLFCIQSLYPSYNSSVNTVCCFSPSEILANCVNSIALLILFAVSTSISLSVKVRIPSRVKICSRNLHFQHCEHYQISVLCNQLTDMDKIQFHSSFVRLLSKRLVNGTLALHPHWNRLIYRL